MPHKPVNVIKRIIKRPRTQHVRRRLLHVRAASAAVGRTAVVLVLLDGCFARLHQLAQVNRLLLQAQTCRLAQRPLAWPRLKVVAARQQRAQRRRRWPDANGESGAQQRHEQAWQAAQTAGQRG